MNQYQLQLLKMMLDAHMVRARSERGASAVEWVVISGLVAGIAIVISVILTNRLSDRANSIDLGE